MEQKEDEDDDIALATGNDVIEVCGVIVIAGDDVTDDGRGLNADGDSLQDKRSVYDNDDDAPW